MRVRFIKIYREVWARTQSTENLSPNKLDIKAIMAVKRHAMGNLWCQFATIANLRSLLDCHIDASLWLRVNHLNITFFLANSGALLDH